MNTGTAPKKKRKASLFGIPYKTFVIALAVVILAALLLSFLLVGIERIVGWPSWLRTEPVPIHRLP